MHTYPPITQQVDTDKNQETALFLLQTIKRPGIESLIDYLCDSDYFIAPASTKYHNSFEGGLCQHSLNVTREFSKENAKWEKPIPRNSVILCGLLHDLCKVGAYAETTRGYEKVKDLPKGHARLSISRATKFIELTPVELNIILYHMGLFGAYLDHEFTAWALHKAIIGTPQVQAFAAVDMADSKRKTGTSKSSSQGSQLSHLM